jgi:hypothetical protein
MHDLACVVHLHSTYSDGTGTVRQIAKAGRRAGADVVLLTDHDTLAALRNGEEGWYGDVLLLVGEEVSPRRRNHYLAFGLDEEIDHSDLDAAGICHAVRAAGGFGFAAHPFSEGSERFKRAGLTSKARARRALTLQGMPFDALDCDALDGIELWSFVNDTGEAVESVPQMLRFLLAPGLALDHPPKRNMDAWDELCRTRRVVAIGGVDAHQYGKRIGPFVPLRLMAYHRSFRHIRTHVLCEGPPDRTQVYDALRAGRCYIAVDSIGPPRGFAFEADDLPMGAEAPAGKRTLTARTPADAKLRLLCDGREIAGGLGRTLETEVENPGVYRVEALRRRHGRERTWILSNPIYLR